jgi:hypothetical protein
MGLDSLVAFILFLIIQAGTIVLLLTPDYLPSLTLL